MAEANDELQEEQRKAEVALAKLITATAEHLLQNFNGRGEVYVLNNLPRLAQLVAAYRGQAVDESAERK